ncbi:hypothetical protein ACLOJK_007168 [Asimina triloba]
MGMPILDGFSSLGSFIDAKEDDGSNDDSSDEFSPGSADLVGNGADPAGSKEEGVDIDEFCSLGSRMVGMVGIWCKIDSILVGLLLPLKWPEQILGWTVADEWV